MKNQKKRPSNGININWLTIFMLIALFVIILAFIYLIISIIYQNAHISNLQTQLDSLKSNMLVTESNLYIEYYRELSNKTDTSMGLLFGFVGISVSLFSIFSLLLAFKAPHDIDKRINELKGELEAAKEATEEAKYQAKIANALTEKTCQEQIVEFTGIIKEFPNKHNAYAYRGLAKYHTKKYDNALADYEIAYGLGMEKYAYNNLVGLVYLEKNEHQNAVDYFTKSIEDNPDGYTAYCNRSFSYIQLNEYEKASSDIDKAIFLYPDYFQAYINRYELYTKIISNDESLESLEEYSQKASEALDKAREIDPENIFFKT